MIHEPQGKQDWVCSLPVPGPLMKGVYTPSLRAHNPELTEPRTEKHRTQNTERELRTTHRFSRFCVLCSVGLRGAQRPSALSPSVFCVLGVLGSVFWVLCSGGSGGSGGSHSLSRGHHPLRGGATT